MKSRLKKFIALLIIIFICYIIYFLLPHNYKMQYKINTYSIEESYKNKIYYFKIINSKNKYLYATSHKYVKSRKLISKIKKDSNCLKVTSKIDKFTICKSNKNYISEFLNVYDNNKGKSKENFKIYDLNNYSYLIWNYNYFYGLNNDELVKIKIFDKDFYNLDNVIKYNDSLLVAGYDSEYSYNSLFIINPSTFKYKKIELNKNIYVNSYFLGIEDNYLYVYDIQRKQEYQINLKTGETLKYNNLILNNKTWEKVSENKLNKKIAKFKYDKDFYYEISNNKLYYITPVNKILISNSADNIIEQNDEYCFYLIKDTIYYVKKTGKSFKVISYSEWEFNNKNIYIF